MVSAKAIEDFLSVKRTPAQIREYLRKNGVKWELSETGRERGIFDIIITYPKLAPMARIYKPRYSETYILQLWERHITRISPYLEAWLKMGGYEVKSYYEI